MHVVPLSHVFTFSVKDLHSVVLSVRNIDEAFSISADGVDNVKLSGARAWLAPCEKKLPIG